MNYPYFRGFTLMEILIAMGIASIFMTATTKLVIAAGSSYQLQRNLGELQENIRFALGTVGSEIRQTGYDPQPWSSSVNRSLLATNLASKTSDEITLRRWSDRNCYENLNSVANENGMAAYFLRESRFYINSSKNLVHSCSYGRDKDSMTVQIRNLGLVQHAESFQALFAEDTNADGNADRWVKAGEWNDEKDILAIRIGLLVASPDPLNLAASSDIAVLDYSHSPADDGRMRKVIEASFTLHSRKS